MYKVLLVDDEPLVLEGLKLLVDWRAQGFEVCAEASDGEDACEAIGRWRPDLVVTDIRMPAMDGLELIRRTRAGSPASARTKFIVLSGHGDFRYAREAMKHETADYLLKPIDGAEFDRTLARLRTELGDERDRSEAAEADEDAEAADIAALTLLVRGDGEPAVRERAAARLGLEARSDVFVVLPDRRVELRAFAEAAWRAGLREPRGAGRLLLFRDGAHGFGAALTGRPECNASALSALRERLCDAAGDSVHLAVSSRGQGPDELKALHEEAGRLRRQLPFDGRPLSPGVHVALPRSQGAILTASSPLPAETDADWLRRLIEAGDSDAVARSLDQLLGELRTKGMPPEVLGAYMSYLTLAARQACGTAGDDEEERKIETAAEAEEAEKDGDWPSYSGRAAIGLSGSSPDPIDRIASLRDQRDLLVALARRAAERAARTQPAVARAVRILKERYREPLKLLEVARLVGLQPAYLGQLFKKETGDTFNGYLHAVRVEEARKRLLREDLKIAAVAREVGYADPEDFTRRFKEAVGMTPSAYRQPANPYEEA